jgi:hypothetical protein
MANIDTLVKMIDILLYEVEFKSDYSDIQKISLNKIFTDLIMIF